MIKKFPFYYGWFLLPFASMGIMMSIPGQTAGFSAFTESLLDISGLSRTALSTAYLIGTITSGFILPFMGKLVDRLGARIVMMTASSFLGLTLFAMSRVDAAVGGISAISSLTGSGGLIPIQAVYFAALTIGIFCLRFFGQGMLPLTANTMVGKWFEVYRGRAVAILGMANSLAFSAAPAVMNSLVSVTGWKNAWLYLALVLGIGMTSIAFLVYRKDPESCGLHVDGIIPAQKEENEDTESLQDEIAGVTLNEALHTVSFWLLIAGLAVHAAIFTGFTFHIEAIGLQAGMSVRSAVAVFIPISFVTMPLSFLGSWASRKIHPVYYIYAHAGSQILAFISIFFLATPAGYIGTIIGIGISGGLMGPVMSAIIPLLYGRKHLGAINGVVSSLTVIGSAVGPFYLSMFNDISGSILQGVTASAVLPGIVLVTAVFLRKHITPAA